MGGFQDALKFSLGEQTHMFGYNRITEECERVKTDGIKLKHGKVRDRRLLGCCFLWFNAQKKTFNQFPVVFMCL